MGHLGRDARRLRQQPGIARHADPDSVRTSQGPGPDQFSGERDACLYGQNDYREFWQKARAVDRVGTGHYAVAAQCARRLWDSQRLPAAPHGAGGLRAALG